MSRARTIPLRLPGALIERAEAAAATCGLTVREFVSQTAHGALAARLCLHGAAPATPAPEADRADGGEDD